MNSQYMVLPSVFDADRRRLAALFDAPAEEGGERLWKDDELGALLRHQLDASVAADLSGLDPKMGRRVCGLAELPGPPIRSFGDLLFHPNPPIEPLKAVKDFAKVCRLSRRTSLPHEIATALYFASIAAALTRGHCRITSLTDSALTDGFRWMQALPWMDASARALAEEALRGLSAQPKIQHA